MQQPCGRVDLKRYNIVPGGDDPISFKAKGFHNYRSFQIHTVPSFDGL
jgi:hypothetical protein